LRAESPATPVVVPTSRPNSDRKALFTQAARPLAG